MATQARHPVDGGIYHVLKRGNCRMDIFEKAGNFQSFIKLLEEGRQRCSMRILVKQRRCVAVVFPGAKRFRG